MLQLCFTILLFLLRCSFLQETRQVPEVLEELEVAWSTALGVVAIWVEAFRCVLEPRDGPQDLHLAENRDGVPRFERARRRELREGDLEGRGEHAVEMEPADVDQEARARGHRDATVLDLRVPKESERLLAADTCEAQRVPDLAAQLFADALEVREGRGHPRADGVLEGVGHAGGQPGCGCGGLPAHGGHRDAAEGSRHVPRGSARAALGGRPGRGPEQRPASGCSIASAGTATGATGDTETLAGFTAGTKCRF